MEDNHKGQPYTLTSVVSLGIAFMLFGVGFAILTDLLQLGTVDWWLSVLLLLIGIFMLSTPGGVNMSIGLLLSGVGLFSLLRTMGIIETSWLRYGLGGFLMLTSTVNIFRNVFGTPTPINKTWRRKNSWGFYTDSGQGIIKHKSNMKNLLLKRIRLSYYFVFFLCVFTLIAFNVPTYTFSSGALTLFSVNSFLYGFYIAPILAGQKARIEELHKIIRTEANELFRIALSVKPLPDKTRNEIQTMLGDYIHASVHSKDAAHGELQYEHMISYCLNYKGSHQKEIDSFLDKLVNNQQNRTLFAMQFRNSVYSNEWIIMLVLFSITLSFVALIDTGDSMLLRIVAALLCTGLSMLLVILAKLSTLTHKKAKQMWNPMIKLRKSRFYRFD